jgi:hypothetical protein
MPIERRLLTRLSLRAPLGEAIYLRAVGTLRDRSTVDPDSLLVDQGTLSGSAEIGWSNDRNNLVFSHTRGMFRDPTRLNGEWHRSRYAGRVSRHLGRQLELALYAFADRRHRPDGTWLSRERRAEGRISWHPPRPFSLWVAVARDLQEANEDRYERDQWELLMGARRRLFWNLSLEADGALFVAARDGKAESHRWNLRLSRSFSFGRTETFIGGKPLEFGSIHGCVFDDLNCDGERQAAEPGIPGQAIVLGSGAKAVTDGEGCYRFDRAAVGGESVSFDARKLPPRYLIPSVRRQLVSLEPGEGATTNFAVTRAASVHGRVVGLGSDNERAGLGDVLVRVQGSRLDVFTNSNGEFSLGDLRAETITLEVVPWSLPENARDAIPPPRRVSLVAGEAASCGDFVVVLSEPIILQRFRPMAGQRPDSDGR